MTNLKKKLPFMAFILIAYWGILTRLSLISSTNFWYDEAFSGILIREEWGNMLQIINQDAVHPPLYYFLLKIWASIFSNADVTLRSFSLLFGILLIVGSFFLLKKLFNTKAALVGSTIFTLSPFFILYSLEARSYSMLALEVLIAVVLFIRISRKQLSNFKELATLRETWLLVLVCLAMFLTHYLSIGLIGAFAALLIVKMWPLLGKIMWTALILITVLVIGRGILNNGDYNIYPTELTHTHWLSEATPLNGGELLYSFIFGVDSQALAKQEVFNIMGVTDTNLVYVFALTILVVVIPALYLAFKGPKHTKITSQLLLFCLALMLVVSLLGVNVLLPRYLTFLGVVFVVWIASLFETINWKLTLLVGATYLFLLTQVQWSNSSRQFNLEELERLSQTTRVVTVSPFDFLVLKYHLNDSPNLYFLDDEHFHMSENYWPYFYPDEVLEATEEGDFILYE